MKKLTLVSTALIAAGILYTGNNFANAQESKLSFGFNIGAGIPMGAYAKNDSTALPIAAATKRYNNAHPYPQGYNANDTTKLNGFAKTGFSFNVYGQYRLAGPIGIKLMVGGTMNSYDASAFTSAYAPVWATYHYTGVPSPTWTASKSYYIGEYMLGPCLRLPAGEKLKIEAQVLVGLVTGSYPSLTGTTTFSGTGYTETYTQNFSTVSSVSAFGYNFSAGFEYKFAPLMGLHLNVGYTGTSFSYSSYTTSTTLSETASGVTSTNNYGPNTYNFAKTMAVGILAITLGFSVDL